MPMPIYAHVWQASPRAAQPAYEQISAIFDTDDTDEATIEEN